MTFTRGNSPRDLQRREENNKRFAPVRIKNMTVLATTERAALLCEDFETGGENPRQVWLPRSQMTLCVPVQSSWEKDDVVEFNVPRWLAEERELFWE